MLQFLHPGWLWAAASVAVPIAIHFWNKKPPRVLLVGSIQFFRQSKSQKLSQLALAQLWLLLLRCLLLLVLVLVLAGLQIKREVVLTPQRHVYLHPALFQPAYLAQIAPAVDSLAARGWRVFRLQPGFPEVAVAPEISIYQFQTNQAAPDTTNAWAMLRVLNRSLPAQARAHIFSTNLLRHHRGVLPTRRPEFTWVPVSVPQASVWLQEAYYTSANQLLLRFGRSAGQEITFFTQTVAKPVSGQTLEPPGFPAVQFTAHARTDSVTLLAGTKNVVALAKTPMRVLVRYAASRQADVRFVRAALQSALEFKGIAFDLAVSAEPQPLPTAEPDWVFWLTDEPLAPFLARFPEKRFKTLQDARASAKVQKTESWLQIPGLPQTIGLHQQTAVLQANPLAEVLWQNGFGQPMLTREQDAGRTRFQFYSRFHPAWNGLPDSGNFPELLLRLLFPENDVWLNRFDTRALPENVESPKVFSASFLENSSKTADILVLKYWLLALAAMLLALERWLTGKTLTASA